MHVCKLAMNRLMNSVGWLTALYVLSHLNAL
jgi:hypothetical protein